MMELDIPVGLGVDGCAANNGMSILEEIRSGYLMHRLNTPDNGVSGYDMLKLATMGGARVRGREKEIGSIELGKCADLILLTVNSLDMVGAYYDPMSIWAQSASKITSTIPSSMLRYRYVMAKWSTWMKIS